MYPLFLWNSIAFLHLLSYFTHMLSLCGSKTKLSLKPGKFKDELDVLFNNTY